jgi:D-tyrosyl-tRNA(Tyr) deacylase
MKVMRAVIQRVTKASVSINEIVKSKINQGMLVFIGIEGSDENTDVEWPQNL